MKIHQIIESIDSKVERLLADSEELLEEREMLLLEIKRLKKVAEQQQERIIRLEHNMIALKKAKSGQLSENEQLQLNNLLGTYIEEIDKCITLLGQ